MTTKHLRELYFSFFTQRGHHNIPSASLIPKEDPTVLFTPAGMHPLVPYLLGQRHPQGTRLVSVQKCIRTIDIDEVGDTTHLTFFEMLGNWSLGDYWKQQSIEWSWEFLTSPEYLAIAPEKLFITIFKGEQGIPQDDESLEIWKKLFTNVHIHPTLDERIFALGRKDNFWGPVGDTGPCGPDTEIFYDTSLPKCSAACAPGCGCGKFVEIWNNVFMEYEKTPQGSYAPLEQKNVDTGMGVERVAAVLSNKISVFTSDVFAPLMDLLGGDDKKRRIIADHIKAACFIIADGITPSNKEQGYIVRRLLRRAFIHIDELELSPTILDSLITEIVRMYENIYPEIKTHEQALRDTVAQERAKFGVTLAAGMKKLRHYENQKTITGAQAFELFATYGFPLELTQSLAREKGITVDEHAYREEFESHQKLSRQGAEHTFKGGLLDHSEMSIHYHTATHLLLASLRNVLGGDIMQKGSNITPERLRLDFNYPEKMTSEQLSRVETTVNQAIQDNLTVTTQEMPIEEARSAGALGAFGEKYGDTVRVYSMGDYSKEICGGPHVEHTGVLGTFKIIKEEGISAGIRRIKAVLI